MLCELSGLSELSGLKGLKGLKELTRDDSERMSIVNFLKRFAEILHHLLEPGTGLVD